MNNKEVAKSLWNKIEEHKTTMIDSISAKKLFDKNKIYGMKKCSN